jgi:glycine/D-amino acid oxidase-like deaminating enzyme
MHDNNVKHYNTHVYGAVQERNNTRRIAVGGPRIELPTTYNSNDFDALNPHTFKQEWNDTLSFLQKLINLPVKMTKQMWGGVMCFPVDEKGPLIGTVKGIYENTLHLNTAYESSGFRQAMGGGELLAKLLVYDDAYMQGLNIPCWKSLLPDNRVTITQ